MERDYFKEVTFDDVTLKNDGLAKAVCDRAVDYHLAGLMPFEPYERLVERISFVLRSWCMYYVWEDVDTYVGVLAKAFILFIRARYDIKEIKSEDDEDAYLDKITEGEYEAFSECLRADVSQELLRRNSHLVGLREFLKMEKKNKIK